jgi:hypothetical protein
MKAVNFNSVAEARRAAKHQLSFYDEMIEAKRQVEVEKMEKTPWFHGSVKPAHVGVYERSYACDESNSDFRCPNYALWTGEFWCSGSQKISDAADGLSTSSFQPHIGDGDDFRWRGLAEKA